MKSIILIGLVLLAVLASGCGREKITIDNPEYLIGGDKDEGGCLIGAGYSWCEAKQKCLRIWEENCSETPQKACTMEAKLCPDGSSVGRTGPNCEFAACPGEKQGTADNNAVNNNAHVCTNEESLQKACTLDYNPVCGKIVLNMGKTVYETFGNACGACAAMKVVSYVPGECPASKTNVMCADQKGNYMTLQDAEDIAKASECGDNLIVDCTCPAGYRKDGESCNPECYYSTPKCLAPSVQCENTYVCNEGTETFWINLNMTKKGCSPACVINLETNKAEINWRCTGLVTQ